MRIGYVLLEWPRYSETFILNELLALAPHGQPVHIFLIRGTRENKIPQEFATKVECLSDDSGDVPLSLRELLTLLAEQGERLVRQVSVTYSKYLSRDNSADEESRREPFFSLGCAVRLVARCRELNIDHLHCHYANLPTSVAVTAHKLGGPTFSFTGHAKDIFTMEPSRLARKLADAKFVISCSEAGCAILRQAAPEAEPHIHRVYHGIWNRDWQVPRAPASGQFQIVAVGRLTRKKGFATLIEAVAELRQRGVEITVEIIGEGREREPLLSLAQQVGVTEHVALPGQLSHDLIRERFARAAAFVLPSIILETNNQDGVANAVLEAMAAGVPVVVSDIPALQEVITDCETGLIFPRGNATALADQLQALLANPAAGERLSANARERVKQMDCSAAAEQLMTLFRRYVEE